MRDAVAAESGTPAEAVARLERARGVLRSVEERAVGPRPGPAAAAGGVGSAERRVLPVAEPLARLLPEAGLRRGSTVAVSTGPGSTSLLLALLAQASAGGAWVGVVGRPELGLVAAAEAGVRLERLALVPHPGGDLVAVTAALLDGLDVVAVAGVERAGMRAPDRRRLEARARQRGVVLVPLGSWPGADVELSCSEPRWEGLGAGADGGSGRLCARGLRVRSSGRGIVGRSGRMLLPASGGRVAAAEPGEVPRWSASGRERIAVAG